MQPTQNSNVRLRWRRPHVRIITWLPWFIRVGQIHEVDVLVQAFELADRATQLRNAPWSLLKEPGDLHELLSPLSLDGQRRGIKDCVLAMLLLQLKHSMHGHSNQHVQTENHTCMTHYRNCGNIITRHMHAHQSWGRNILWFLSRKRIWFCLEELKWLQMTLLIPCSIFEAVSLCSKFHAKAQIGAEFIDFTKNCNSPVLTFTRYSKLSTWMYVMFRSCNHAWHINPAANTNNPMYQRQNYSLLQGLVTIEAFAVLWTSMSTWPLRR